MSDFKSQGSGTGTAFFSFLLTAHRLLLTVFLRRAEVVAEEDADGEGLAVACGGAEVHLADGGDDRFVETEAGPADDLDAPDLAVRADFDRDIDGRLRARARRFVRVGRPQTPVGRGLAV